MRAGWCRAKRYDPLPCAAVPDREDIRVQKVMSMVSGMHLDV